MREKFDRRILRRYCGTDNRKKSRIEKQKYKEDLKNYGFSREDTWSLDVTISKLLLERLIMYKTLTKGIIDLEYHKINVDGIEYTQKEIMNKMISLLKRYIKSVEDSEYEESIEVGDRVWKLWSKSYAYFWW